MQSPIIARIFTTMPRPNCPRSSQRQPLIRQLASSLVRAHVKISAPRHPRALGRIPESAQGRHPLMSAFDVELEAAVEFEAVALAPAGAAGEAGEAAAPLHFGSLQ